MLLLEDFEIELLNPIIYEDNQSCLQIIEKENINPRSKNIGVKYYFVKDLLNNNKTKYKYSPTDQMLADTPVSKKAFRIKKKFLQNFRFFE